MQSAGSETQLNVGDHIKYLSSGRQTALNPEILQLASGIQGNVTDKANQILGIIDKFESRQFDYKVFRKRTAAQIIKDRFVTGCTDDALAFITLARAAGIPSKYVETIDVSWLKEGRDNISGHIYAQIYDENAKRWIWVNPAKRSIGIPPRTDRVIFKEGLDSWDIGITDFESLSEQFQVFRKSWLEQQSNKES